MNIATQPAPAAAAHLDPLAVRKGFVQTSKGQIHYRVAGQGKPLFLLHPSPFSSRRFTPLLPMMGAHRRVYALDTPGYGESYRPQTQPNIYDYADAVAEAIAGLGYDRAPLYGDLTGSIVALATAVKHPDRVSALCLGVVPYYDRHQDEADRRRRNFPTMFQLDAIPPDGSHFSTLYRRMIDKGVHRVHPDQHIPLSQIDEWVLERMEMLESAPWGFESVYNCDIDAGVRGLKLPILIAATETHGNEEQIARSRQVLPNYEVTQGPQSFQIEEVRNYLAEVIPPFLDRHGV